MARRVLRRFSWRATFIERNAETIAVAVAVAVIFCSILGPMLVVQWFTGSVVEGLVGALLGFIALRMWAKS